MGIPPGSPIVCFHSWDLSYAKVREPGADYWEHANRVSDIDTFIPAIKELVARGYYAIRMGKVVNKPFMFKHPQVIDYGMSSWKSEFADLYLISRCHFYLGTSCGLDAVASFFRKEWVIVNLYSINIAHAWSPKYLYIFKKLWLMKEKRFLTFKQIIDSKIGYSINPKFYKNAGIEVISNTSEEIFDVIIEKEERMRGTWQTNDEYEELQRRYWSLFKPDHLNKVFKTRLGSKFLLQNKHLLD